MPNSKIAGSIKLSKSHKGVLFLLNLDELDSANKFYRDFNGNKIIVASASIENLEDVLNGIKKITPLIIFNE